MNEAGEAAARAAADLDAVAYLLERSRAGTYKVRAFRGAAATVRGTDPVRLLTLAAEGSLQDLAGIGRSTAGVVLESLAGGRPVYLVELEAAAGEQEQPAGHEPLRSLLRGDCHTHSDWSDGGSPIEVMAAAGQALGHDWMVLTDHSPRLTVAHGLTAERLTEQLDVVAEVNERLAPFRLLTGIEVDIFDDGSLDQTDELLARLDLVVASVHSKLRMPASAMTPRLLAAVANRHVDVLGHCTGRLVTGRGRPESEFDADRVFAACAESGVAVEVNSRPERLDPPRRLLTRAVEAGCLLAIDTDAHAPGQLEWQWHGCVRAQECGADPGGVVNTWGVDRLLAWTHGR